MIEYIIRIYGGEMMKNNRWERMKKYNFRHRLGFIMPIISVGLLMALVSEITAIIIFFTLLPLMAILGTDFVESAVVKNFKNTCFCFFHNDDYYEVTQRLTSMKDYVDSKILKDRAAYYKMSAVNLINQLPIHDTEGKRMHYSFVSHAYTMYLFRILERKRYVQDVVINRDKSNDALSSYAKALGYKPHSRRYKLYQVSFTLTDKVDKPHVALELINEVGLDQERFRIVKDASTYYLKIRYRHIIKSRIFKSDALSASSKIKTLVK